MSLLFQVNSVSKFVQGCAIIKQDGKCEACTQGFPVDEEENLRILEIFDNYKEVPKFGLVFNKELYVIIRATDSLVLAMRGSSGFLAKKIKGKIIMAFHDEHGNINEAQYAIDQLAIRIETAV